MYTQCSSCATLFRVSARHLREAQGRVRCCLCHETFSALATLAEVLPPDLPVSDLLAGRARIAAATSASRAREEPPGVAPENPHVSTTPPLPWEDAERVDATALLPREDAEPVEATAPLPWEDAEPLEDAAPQPHEAAPAWEPDQAPLAEAAAEQALIRDPVSAEPAPPGRDLFAELEEVPLPEPMAAGAAARRRPWGALAWAIGCLSLIALLLVQYGYLLIDRSFATSPGQAMQADYVRDPRYRPWFEGFCWIAGCRLPLLRDVAQVQILRRQVTVPAPGALLVSATLVNDATFAQPYPQLRLGFLDVAGRERASRWFLPTEYLEEARSPEQLAQGMPPKVPVAVRLDLVDPGKGAAESFRFDFR